MIVQNNPLGNRINKFLLILSFFLCSILTENLNAQSKLDAFISNLKEVNLPFSTKDLSEPTNVSSDFFYFEKDNTYYELQNLKSFGFFKKGSSTFILYNFNLSGLGEGFANDMIILSSFSEESKHFRDIILQGAYGGEGGANVYKDSVVTDKNITVTLTDEHYESDTGLPYSIIEFKSESYKFDKNDYVLTDQTFRCDPLNKLEDYRLELKKGLENDENSIHILSYKLDNYLHCFPISTQNVATYTSINNYFKKTHTLNQYLTKMIKNTLLNNNKLIVSVNNLRMRSQPSLEGEVIELLSLGSQLSYTKMKSSYTMQITLNNKEIEDYWYKVRTEKGKLGWVHGCCVNF